MVVPTRRALKTCKTCIEIAFQRVLAVVGLERDDLIDDDLVRGTSFALESTLIFVELEG